MLIVSATSVAEVAMTTQQAFLEGKGVIPTLFALNMALPA
jgi:hypothetical protein